MPTTPAPFFKGVAAEIIDCLKSLPQTIDDLDLRGTTAWTRLLKEKITEIGHQHHYLVAPHDTGKQWLYDLVWFKNEKAREGNHLSEVALVLESEWQDDDEALYDFEKLLQAKAPLKVMICEEEKAGDFPRLQEMFRESIRIFGKQSPEETYIIAILKKPDAVFEIFTEPGAPDP